MHAGSLRPRDYGLVLLAAMLWWLLVAVRTGALDGGLTTVLLSSYDAKVYVETGDWLLGRLHLSEAGFGPTVYPFFYPLLVAICLSLHGALLVLLQLVFRAATIGMLMAMVAGRLSRRGGIVAGLAYATLVTPTMITLHALADTTTALAVMTALFFLDRHLQTERARDYLLFVAALVFGVLSKTIFLYPTLAALAVGAYRFRAQRKHLAVMGALTLPILLQVLIMSSAFGINRPSMADTYTLDHFLLAEVDARRGVLDFHQTRARRHERFLKRLQVEEMRRYDREVKEEVRAELLRSPLRLLSIYGTNLRDNLTSGSQFAGRRRFYRLSVYQHRALVWLFGLLVLITLIRHRRRLFFDGLRLTLILLPAYFMFSTGIASRQGDRYAMLYALPIMVLAAISWPRRVR